MAFWNAAKFNNKDRDFREELRKWDTVISLKTLVDKKSWKRIKRLTLKRNC